MNGKSIPPVVKTVVIGVLGATSFLSRAEAQIVTWANPGSAGNWNEASNWDPSGVPGSGAEINLTATGNNSTVITVSDSRQAAKFTSGARGALIIANGGTLTMDGTGTSDFRGTMALTIQNGGAFVKAGTGGSLRFDTIVNSGGSLEGFATVQGTSLTLDGTWKPRGTSSGQVTLSQGAELLGSGTIVLDLKAHSSGAEFFSISGSTTEVNFANFSAIQLLPTAPVSIGDSFDLWNSDGNATVTPGTGGNIVLMNSPGLTLDLSGWATTGVVTVIAVPEPSAGILLGLAGWAGLCLRRRPAR